MAHHSENCVICGSTAGSEINPSAIVISKAPSCKGGVRRPASNHTALHEQW